MPQFERCATFALQLSANPAVLGLGWLQILNSGAGLPKDPKKRLFWGISSSSHTHLGKFYSWDVFSLKRGNIQ